MPDKLDTIGRLEYINFPEWNMYEINAKIDTGAYTSSLHCHHIEQFQKDETDYVRFNLLDPSHEVYNDRLFELPVHKIKAVKSSNGETEERIIIEALIELMNKRIKAELSLTDRSEMRHPVLIGRKLIKSHFLVDVSKKYISQKKP